MKNVSLMMVAIAVIAVGASACKKAATPPTGETSPTATPATPSTTPPTEATPPTAGTTLPTEEIAGAISKAVCTVMTKCEKNKVEGQPPVTEADCTSMMTKDLSQALPEKAKVVNKDQLSKCIAAITTASCEDLDKQSAPSGCEFMN